MKLSEEEIINSITPIVNARKTHKDDNLYSLHLNAYQLDGLQGLLDLYCSKTEQLNTALNSINYWKNLYDDTFAEYERYKGKHSLIKRHYVSKDKIREKIKEYEGLKEMDMQAYEEQVKPLKEILEEE